MSGGRLLAVSDLHVRYAENRAIVDGLRPGSDQDWLIVAGDVAEYFADVRATLTLLRDRFATVIWAPGNHELWTLRDDPVQLRGEARYRELVAMCRELSVLTPEDAYPVWPGPDGPVTGYLRGCPGFQAGEESDPCGAGQGKSNRCQGDWSSAETFSRPASSR